MAKTAPVLMFDSVNAQQIPLDAEVVAGYIDGRYAWGSTDWDRFPNAEKVTITVLGDISANVADVETGDLTPADGRKFIIDKQAAGYHGATIYCNRDSLSAVRTACQGLAYYIWVADWTNAPHEINGTIGTQYENDRVLNVDLSMIYSQDWLNIIDEANRNWTLG